MTKPLQRHRAAPIPPPAGGYPPCARCGRVHDRAMHGYDQPMMDGSTLWVAPGTEIIPVEGLERWHFDGVTLYRPLKPDPDDPRGDVALDPPCFSTTMQRHGIVRLARREMEVAPLPKPELPHLNEIIDRGRFQRVDGKLVEIFKKPSNGANGAQGTL